MVSLPALSSQPVPACIGQPSPLSATTGTPGSSGPAGSTRSFGSLSIDAPVAPHVLRAIRARHALGMCGRMMLKSTTGGFACSNPTEEIDEFWSHSWHCGWWSKMSTLWLYYNSVPGAAAGVLVSFASGFWAPRQELAMLLSIAVFFMVTAWWPRCNRVFLDKACIVQDDDVAKRAGILSLGFTLRSSATLLCLWDETYLTRLWCVFEYAARLYMGDRGYSSRIVVMPTYYGFMATCISASCFAFKSFHVVLGYLGLPFGNFYTLLCAFAALTCCTLLFGRVVIRRTRAFELQKRQLENFATANVKCFCCSVAHREPVTGRHLVCDRILIEQTLMGWFGSIADFDAYVSTTVRRQVHAGSVLPYRYLVLACTPLLHAQVYRWVESGIFSSGAGVYGLFETMVSGPVAWNTMLKIFNCAARRSVRATVLPESDMPIWQVLLVAVLCSLGVATLFVFETLAFTYLEFYEALGLLTFVEGIALIAFYLPRSVWKNSVFPR